MPDQNCQYLTDNLWSHIFYLVTKFKSEQTVRHVIQLLQFNKIYLQILVV